MLAGSTVLVTGAAGSVGAALMARLIKTANQVVAIDHHEASLFRLGRNLGNPPNLQLRLADIRNAPKIKRIMVETRPTAVFHLAAYKHVPFGETEPDETIAVNVLGTIVLATAAAETGCQQFVYPSSDKAVNPPNLYGATKRIAESWVLSRADSSPMAVHAVRYVNILGTSGSVIETFAQQALADRPLTLTDERMTRYWMAMDEATALLVHAIGLANGSCSVLDVGDPIPVRAMASRVWAHTRGDGSSPEITLTGARPGERLAEELISRSETVTRCEGDPVLRVVHSRRDACTARVLKMVPELEAMLADSAADAIRARAMDFAAELQ